MQHILSLIESALDTAVESSLFPQAKPYPEAELYKAVRYSLLGGGKRLRPLLTLVTASLYGVEAKEALSGACAVEMVHTYSLIHDDLPAMDNDDFRRGKPSLHKAFGEALAILAGDYLLTKAFEILATSHHLPASTRLEMIQTLSHCAGGRGMIGGQVLDLHLNAADVTPQHLEITHEMKTGALMTAAIVLGALAAQAPKEDLIQLARAGYQWGLAFQIHNDLLDVHSKKSDAENGKNTAVHIYGKEKALKRIHELYATAEQLQLSVSATPLIEFCAQFYPLKEVAL